MLRSVAEIEIQDYKIYRLDRGVYVSICVTTLKQKC